MERKFREKLVIGRIEEDKFLLDFRTILPHNEVLLIDIIKQIVG